MVPSPTIENADARLGVDDLRRGPVAVTIGVEQTEATPQLRHRDATESEDERAGPHQPGVLVADEVLAGQPGILARVDVSVGPCVAGGKRLDDHLGVSARADQEQRHSGVAILSPRQA
ncbi:MAG: hypothetical protein IPM60_09855 [Rhodospirillales bacterium]|nr:hypothetical protein [Rhodospirillales bacterium]